jgi:molybdopterin molybdotransferase
MPPVEEILSLAEAQALVLARARPLSPETLPLAGAAGRFLAEPARAVVDLPPFRSSAMDGYALRAGDTPGRLPVVFRIAAGAPATRALEAGEAMGIATGGLVPEGADAVVQHELVVESDNAIELDQRVAQGANVREPGRDVAAGAVVAEAGTRLGAAQIGALAAAGVAEVVCARRPRVAVLTTGTELREPGSPLGPGEVYEANGVMLAAQLASAGVEVTRLASVADDEDAHRRALEQGLELDVLVSSGGVSVGPHDLVRRVEAELGVEEVFWRVAVRPGKPVSFGVRPRLSPGVAGSAGDDSSHVTLVFGLPGNPVSTLVGCELFVRPALLALQGAADPGPRFSAGRLAESVSRNAGRDDLLRARTDVTDEGVVLSPVTGQESHMIVRAAEADALVLVPRGEGELAAGASVRYLPL